jgi:hypothetical protein
VLKATRNLADEGHLRQERNVTDAASDIRLGIAEVLAEAGAPTSSWRHPKDAAEELLVHALSGADKRIMGQ